MSFRKEDSDKLIGVIKKVCYLPTYTLTLLCPITWPSCNAQLQCPAAMSRNAQLKHTFTSVILHLSSIAWPCYKSSLHYSQGCLLLLVSLLDTAMGSMPTELHAFRLLHN